MSQIETHEHAGLRGWVRRHPVLALVLIALPLSYGLMTIPLLAEYDVIPGSGLPARVGLDMEEAASLLLIVSILSSTLAVTYACDGRDGLRVLFSRMTRWRVGLGWWCLAALGLPTGTVALAVLFGDHAAVPSVSTIAGEAGALIFALAVINLAEEATWSGFVQTRLERRVNFFVAVLMTSVPFALVHLPLRVITHEATTAGELLGAFVTIMVLCLFFRSLLAVTVRGAANSILLAATTHTMFNRSQNVDGIGADILTGPNRQAAALLATVVLAVVVVLANRRRLSKVYRLELDAAEANRLSGRR